jgi:hypothetical protein
MGAMMFGVDALICEEGDAIGGGPLILLELAERARIDGVGIDIAEVPNQERSLPTVKDGLRFLKAVDKPVVIG